MDRLRNREEWLRWQLKHGLTAAEAQAKLDETVRCLNPETTEWNYGGGK